MFKSMEGKTKIVFWQEVCMGWEEVWMLTSPRLHLCLVPPTTALHQQFSWHPLGCRVDL